MLVSILGQLRESLGKMIVEEGEREVVGKSSVSNSWSRGSLGGVFALGLGCFRATTWVSQYHKSKFWQVSNWTPEFPNYWFFRIVQLKIIWILVYLGSSELPQCQFELYWESLQVSYRLECNFQADLVSITDSNSLHFISKLTIEPSQMSIQMPYLGCSVYISNDGKIVVQLVCRKKSCSCCWGTDQKRPSKTKRGRTFLRLRS